MLATVTQYIWQIIIKSIVVFWSNTNYRNRNDVKGGLFDVVPFRYYG